MRLVLSMFAVSSVLAACTSTYHPEYHPVTVSHYTQSVTYPGMMPGNQSLPSVTMTVPPPPAPPTAQAPMMGSPDDN